MRSSGGDPELLLRGARRCAILTGELERALDPSGVAHWSGSAALAYAALAGEHGEVMAAQRAVVGRLGMTVGGFAHQLAAEQLRARRESAAVIDTSSADSRIALLHKQFRRQLSDVVAEFARLRGRLCIDPPRWVGPVQRPPDSSRWTGPVRPPVSWVRPSARRVVPVAVRDLADAAGRAQLPWRPPWEHDSVPVAAANGAVP
jgi:hypothetical protein